MDLDRARLTQLGCGALGAAVGGVAAAGWTFGGSTGPDGWPFKLILAYPFVVGVLAVAFAHQRGVLRGLVDALGRILWFVGAAAVWITTLAILFAPFALILIHPVAERFQERWPNFSQELVSGLFVAFGVAVVGVLVKTEVGAIVLGFAFEGLAKATFLMPPLLLLMVFLLWPLGLVLTLVTWLSGGDEPNGGTGAFFALVVGVVGGAAHGYYSARWAADEVDIPMF
jgi:hypothetical protein